MRCCRQFTKIDWKERNALEPILQVKNLTHTYGVGTPFQRSAVEDMSFDVFDGEFLGIIGHTGRESPPHSHLNGLLRPTGGQVLLGGRTSGPSRKNPGRAVPVVWCSSTRSISF